MTSKGFFSFGKKTNKAIDDQKNKIGTVTPVDEMKKDPHPKLINQMMLALTLEQKMTYSTEKIQELQKQLNTLPPIEVGEVNIYPVEAFEIPDGGYYVNTFIRNGGDILLDLSINAITLYLIDADGEKAAGGVFRPENFQSIKFGEARYWTFAWGKEQVFKPNADLSTFKIAFS